ncbi:MAG: PDZ domain-containing protein [Gammaproteobacteria bacterium]|nr:PDZ domain-containing protein [Gammaproteobacteria bacterium]MBU1553423.1 PDZ domain-containing protein [Gammaproteobacteria bacterium]MBU2069755.1 PDZ domain-containing protein [Gammaproteobacteria bacterium]MBU2184620.1 PDZ domain-containing protein [Gammaproteobacteria bacterium]MBU2205714.1 PDZ domain-containing protein [Gammaproteobacteria bacterium]
MFTPRYLLLACALASGAAFASDGTRLLRQPDISATHLAFVYGGDIWLSDKDGKNPRQLSTHPASEFAPKFSPDGNWIAFSAAYDNNTDVYIMPVSGGSPSRLTFHPGADTVNGWSPDGKSVVFASNREIANSRSNQLYQVSVNGGYPEKLMQAVAFEGDLSSDGKKLAYRPNNMAHSGASGWRLHRGGMTPPVWIIDLEKQQLEKIPHPNANEFNPFWLGDTVYFLSDRDNSAVNLFRYRNKQVEQLTRHTDWDLRSAAGHGNSIVYEAGGFLHQFDISSGQSTALSIDINTTSAQKRPQWKDASKTLTSARISSSGQRLVVSARGEVFTVPVKDGSTRNLTLSSGVREFDGLWSPDGSKVAYISDKGNKHQLVLENQDGLTEPEVFTLSDSGYFNLLSFSPDGNLLAYHDNHLNLYAFNLKTKRSQKLDSSQRRDDFSVSFSPDSRYLAYTVSAANYFSQIKLFDFNANKTTQITDGMSHAGDPVFTQDYLYFTASVNTGPSQVGLDLSTRERPVRKAIYAYVLANDGLSPLLPKSGDEPVVKAEDKAAKKDKDDDKAAIKAVKIDLAGLQNRIIALPLAERNYDSLSVADDGALFYVERIQPGSSNEPPAQRSDNDGSLYRFDFEEKKSELVKDNLANYQLSQDGKKLLLHSMPNSLQVGDAKAKPEAKAVSLADVRAFVDPAQEWQQIFNDAWRMQKEYFYDANMHGINWQAIYTKYQPMLKHLQRREDLNDVLVDMIAELQVGHNRIGGGDVHKENSSKVGLLGADFAISNGKYQFKTVYQGDRWSPFLQAPLNVPGASAKAGDYLLAVNGRELNADTNLFALLDNTLGTQLVLSIADNAKGINRRNITVEPIANENQLRLWHWVEQNRQLVADKTDGKVAYVYLPNTADGGFYFFNRMFFAQTDKPAIIIDERRNGGGQAANYITEILGRPFLSGWKDRDGLVFTTPGAGIYGPKTMLIDQDAGSGGDFLPWSFKRLALGKTIGTRTWGGLIGISANPAMIDGGFHVVPFFRFYTPDGEWRVENEGVSPDIEVELDPIAVNQGIDVQLERAIAHTLAELKARPPQDHSKAPAMPKKLGL